MGELTNGGDSGRGLVAPALGTFALCLVVFVVALIGRNHFGPLDGLCNGAQEIEPHQSTGAIVDCSADTWLYSIAVYAFWAAIVIGVVSLITAVLGLIAASGGDAPSRTKGVSKVTVPRGSTTATRAAAGSATTRVAHVRCPKCNAPNDVTSTDVPCFACGAPLAAESSTR